MKQKKKYFRITKIAPKRYMIEQQDRFLWFIKVWSKGCFDLGLPAYMAGMREAYTAIRSKCKEKGIIPVIIRGQKK